MTKQSTEERLEQIERDLKRAQVELKIFHYLLKIALSDSSDRVSTLKNAINSEIHNLQNEKARLSRSGQELAGEAQIAHEFFMSLHIYASGGKTYPLDVERPLFK